MSDEHYCDTGSCEACDDTPATPPAPEPDVAAIEQTVKGHTPGPWVADISEPNDCVVFTKAGKWVTNVDGGMKKDGRRVVAFDQTIADTHLIAAAPTLLALLQEARKELNTLRESHTRQSAWIRRLGVELQREKAASAEVEQAWLAGRWPLLTEPPEAGKRIAELVRVNTALLAALREVRGRIPTITGAVDWKSAVHEGLAMRDVIDALLSQHGMET